MDPELAKTIQAAMEKTLHFEEREEETAEQIDRQLQLNEAAKVA